MKYLVEVTERIVKTYIIEAESVEDAELLAIEGHTYEQEEGIPEKYDVHVSKTEKME